MGPPWGRAGDSQDAFMGSWVVTARQDGAQALGVPGPHPARSSEELPASGCGRGKGSLGNASVAERKHSAGC